MFPINAATGSGHFKDDTSLYRFTKDDGSYPWVEDLSVFMKGKRLYERYLLALLTYKNLGNDQPVLHLSKQMMQV